MNFKALNSKMASLSASRKILLLLSLAIMFGTFWHFIILKPKLEHIKQVEGELAKLQKTLQESRQVCKNLKDFQQEVEKVRMEFLRASAQLPTEKEIPNLLTKISDLGNNSGLEFELFKPEAEVKKEFYYQLPIDIKVRGPYHNVASFFKSISGLDRIVNVGDFTMKSPKVVGNLIILETSCVATTYRFQPTDAQADDSQHANDSKHKEKKG